VLEQLDLEDQLNAEFHHLSLNDVTGTDEGDTLKPRAMVHNKVMLILVDNGSSNSFVRSSFIQKCGISTSSMKPSQVKVANGEILISDKVVKDMEWWIQGHTFHTDMKVLDLGPFDAILGYDWLKSHSPMACHRENRTLSFDHQGRKVFLQGVQPSPPTLLEISSSQLTKWVAGNDIGALDMVEVINTVPPVSVPEVVQHLLDEYADVFMTPKPYHQPDFMTIIFHYYPMPYLLIPDHIGIHLCIKMKLRDK
jgi:hypothetical protein